MSEPLFDRAAEYEAMLQQGISLSGESQEFFIAGRVQDLRSRIPAAPRRILDFGCGTGKTCAHLAVIFPEAQIVGADLSGQALHAAESAFGSDRVRFIPLEDLARTERFDLCYVNGVFHHIRPAERQRTLAILREALAPGGRLAVFENNPWNPGTRMVMRRIPFDRDAIPLSFRELRGRTKEAGFQVHGVRFLFYLPKALAALRFVEPWLAAFPLGAQYYVLASRPGALPQ